MSLYRRHVVFAAALVTASLATWLVAAQEQPKPPSKAEIRQGEALAKRLCVGCHAFSDPDVLPRALWRHTVEKMVMIVEGKEPPGWGEPPRTIPLPEEYHKILAYYESAAPEVLDPLESWPAPPRESPRFVPRPIRFDAALTREPAVANIRLADLNENGRLEALACDMRQGLVLLAAPYEPGLGTAAIAQIPHPAHISIADLDRDGRRDLLIADLGEFLPGDHENGAAVWLRSLPEGGYSAFALRGFPRVADVQAADFDGDGKLDLLVAAFGWNKKGEIALLLNRTDDWSRPSFKRTTVDARPGAIHVLPTDLNGDGKMDFVALISQEHELVVAFLGDGAGGFRARTIYAAPHPNWGSTGIQLTDLDGDRDLDVLVTNGDMFDDDVLKPYHSIQWLENKGRLRFEAHRLARLAGVHRAVAVDLDSDGDLDVVASAFTGAADPSEKGLPSLVWLEQVRRGRFEKRTIETGNATHATLDVGDVDGDGDLDIVTGTFLLQSTSDQWLTVWENQTVKKD